PLRAAYPRDSVPDLLVAVGRAVVLDTHTQADRAGTDVVSERQRALPALVRQLGAAEITQDRLGGGRRDRDHRDARELVPLRTARLDPARALDARPTGRRRVAGTVHHAAALRRCRMAPRADRVDVAPEPA